MPSTSPLGICGLDRWDVFSLGIDPTLEVFIEGGMFFWAKLRRPHISPSNIQPNVKGNPRESPGDR